MNRLLVFPLIGSIAVFAVVLRSHADKAIFKSTAASSGYFARGESYPLLERDLMPLEDAERHILESWPTIDQSEYFSRRGPTQSFYTILDKAEHRNLDESSPSFLFSFFVYADPILSGEETKVSFDSAEATSARRNDHFAIHVDRLTGAMQVFANNEWRDYRQWRDINLPKYRKLTGFGT